MMPAAAPFMQAFLHVCVCERERASAGLAKRGRRI